MQPLISLIIPLYNAEKYVAETIESALQQSYKNIEIIIIDDGSTDSSFSVAESYKSDNILVVKQTNKGASAARNHGLRLAKGEYIQFLDADDILDVNKIEQQINTLKNHSELHLVGCRWRYFNTDVNNTYKTMPFDFKDISTYNKANWLMERPYMIPHTWLVSRRLIELAGFWNESLTLNDDGEYFYRIIAASNGVVMDSRVLAFYRAGNPNSLSTRRTKDAMLSWLESIRSYKRVMFNIAGNKANEAVDKAFFEVSYHCLNVFPDLVELSKQEMYHPEIQYNLYDNLVFNLSKVIGLSKAKKTREFLTAMRNTHVTNFIFLQVKKILGKETY